MNWQRQSYEMIIREHHLDSFGHVNNATYLEIFEEARWEFITKRGYGYDRVHELKIGPVILDLHLSFKKELTLRQKITIESQVIDYRGKIARMLQEIKDESGQVCTRLEVSFGLFDMRARKLISPTPEWMHAMAPQGSDTDR